MLQELDTHPGGHEQRPEIALLLDCCGPAGDDAASAQQPLARPLDWAYLLWVAHRHALLPQLYERIRVADGSGAPAAVVAQLAAHTAGNTRRNEHLLADLGHILRLLDAEGIAALPARVPFLLSQAYEYPGLRQYEPLDVLIAQRDAARAQQVLGTYGYEPIHALTPRQSAALRHTYGIVLQHRTHGGRFHLHERLTPAYLPVRLDLSDMWQRRQILALGELTAPFLGSEDLVLLLCTHGSLNLWNRLLWVADLARLIAAHRSLDWEQIHERARAARVERMLHVGLCLAHGLLGAAVPEAVRERAAADRLVRALVAEARRRLLVDLHGWTGELERARFRLRALQRPLDRLLYAVRFALTPSVEDWQALPLPDALLPVYHLVRPLRLAGALSGSASPKRRAPFMTSPMPVVERMLAMAKVRPNDVVYDLGCGDGRIVITAAQRYGARGVGVDLDAERIVESRANARAAGVEHLVTFVQGDALDVDLRPATVVTLWMLQTLNFRLRPKLRAELRPGARIVGHSFDLGDWTPTDTQLVRHGDESIIIYLWVIGRPTSLSPGK